MYMSSVLREQITTFAFQPSENGQAAGSGRSAEPRVASGVCVMSHSGSPSKIADSTSDNSGLEQLRSYIKQHNIKYVLLDMDLTVTAEHSGGMLPKGDWVYDSYIESAERTDALLVVQLCEQLGVRIGIVTFQQEVDDEVHIGGTKLVRQVLCHLGVDHLIDERSVVTLDREQYAYMVKHQDTYNKNDMIQELFESWATPFEPSEVLLIDDTLRNIKALVSVGGHGVAAHGRSGLSLSAISFHSPPLLVTADSFTADSSSCGTESKTA